MKATLKDDLEIRPFVEDDRYSVSLFLRDILNEFDLLENSGELSADMAKLVRRFSSDGACFWVLSYEGKLAGTIGLRPHGEYTAEIEKLYLKKRFRKRGIGTLILNFTETQAYKLGYRRLFISCPRAMVAGSHFLSKADYRIVGNQQEDSAVDLFEKEIF